MFARIDHVALQVKDAEASAEFYGKYFGFHKERVMDHPAPGLAKIIFLGLGDTRLELLEQEDRVPISGTHFSLTSTDLVADFTALQKAGLRVLQAPVGIGGGRQRAVIQGPDMEEIEIIG